MSQKKKCESNCECEYQEHSHCELCQNDMCLDCTIEDWRGTNWNVCVGCDLDDESTVQLLIAEVQGLQTENRDLRQALITEESE